MLPEIGFGVSAASAEQSFSEISSYGQGGALAHVCAFDLGYSGLNVRPDKKRVPITAYTFCSPRVGDIKFKEAMDAMDIKVRSVRAHAHVLNRNHDLLSPSQQLVTVTSVKIMYH